MQKIAVVGAGRIGTTIASMLAHTGDYHVHVLDPHDQALAALPKHAAIVPVQLTPQMEGTDLAALLAGAESAGQHGLDSPVRVGTGLCLNCCAPFVPSV